MILTGTASKPRRQAAKLLFYVGVTLLTLLTHSAQAAVNAAAPTNFVVSSAGGLNTALQCSASATPGMSYTFQYSTNSGTSWTTAYQGASRNISVTLPGVAIAFSFQVQAYDPASVYLPSSWVLGTISAIPYTNTEHITTSIARIIPAVPILYSNNYWQANNEYWSYFTNSAGVIFLFESTTTNPPATDANSYQSSFMESGLNAWALPSATTNSWPPIGSVVYVYNATPTAAVTQFGLSYSTDSCAGVSFNTLLSWVSTGPNATLTIGASAGITMPSIGSTNIATSLPLPTSFTLTANGPVYTAQPNTATVDTAAPAPTPPTITNFTWTTRTVRVLASDEFSTANESVLVNFQGLVVNPPGNASLIISTTNGIVLTNLPIVSPFNATFIATNSGSYNVTATNILSPTGCYISWTSNLFIPQCAAPTISQLQICGSALFAAYSWQPVVYTIRNNQAGATLIARSTKQLTYSVTDDSTAPVWCSQPTSSDFEWTTLTDTINFTNYYGMAQVSTLARMDGAFTSPTRSSSQRIILGNITATWNPGDPKLPDRTSTRRDRYYNPTTLTLKYPPAQNGGFGSEVLEVLCSKPINGKYAIPLTNGMAVIAIDGNNGSETNADWDFWQNQFSLQVLPDGWPFTPNRTFNGFTSGSSKTNTIEAEFDVNMDIYEVSAISQDTATYTTHFHSLTTNSIITAFTGNGTNNGAQPAPDATFIIDGRLTSYAIAQKPNYNSEFVGIWPATYIGFVNIDHCAGTVTYIPDPNVESYAWDTTLIAENPNGSLSPITFPATAGTHTLRAVFVGLYDQNGDPTADNGGLVTWQNGIPLDDNDTPLSYNTATFNLPTMGFSSPVCTVTDGANLATLTNGGFYVTQTAGNIAINIQTQIPNTVVPIPVTTNLTFTNPNYVLNTSTIPGNAIVPISFWLAPNPSQPEISDCPYRYFTINIVLQRTSGLTAEIPPSDPVSANCLFTDPSGLTEPWPNYNWP